jgi:hypothetical protein
LSDLQQSVFKARLPAAPIYLGEGGMMSKPSLSAQTATGGTSSAGSAPVVAQARSSRRNAPTRVSFSNGNGAASSNGTKSHVTTAPTAADALKQLQQGSGYSSMSIESVDLGETIFSSHPSSTTILPIYTPDEVFVCPEESLFYSQCIEKLVLNK